MEPLLHQLLAIYIQSYCSYHYACIFLLILSTNSQRWIIMIKLLRTSKNHNFEIICMHAAWCKLSNFCFLLHVLMKLLQNIPVTNFKDHSMWFIKVILCLICLPCTSKMKVVHVFFTREAITSGYCRHRKYYRSARKEFIVWSDNTAFFINLHKLNKFFKCIYTSTLKYLYQTT